MNDYIERNKMLKSLGYDSYLDYLNSEKWKAIRARQLRDNPQCVKCANSANQVHHLKYTLSNLSGHSNECMVSICGGCHYSIEFTGKQKVSLDRANDKLFVGNNQKDGRKKERFPSGHYPSGKNYWKINKRCKSCRKNTTKRGKDYCGKCAKDAFFRHIESNPPEPDLRWCLEK